MNWRQELLELMLDYYTTCSPRGEPFADAPPEIMALAPSERNELLRMVIDLQREAGRLAGRMHFGNLKGLDAGELRLLLEKACPGFGTATLVRVLDQAIFHTRF